MNPVAESVPTGIINSIQRRRERERQGEGVGRGKGEEG